MNRRTVHSLFFFLLSILSSLTLLAQSDDCATPTLITPGTSCTYTSGTLYLATNAATSPASTCGTPYDVWYYFDVPSGTTSVVISSAGTGNNVTTSNTFIQAFSNSACNTAASSLSVCTAIGTNVTLNNLTPSTRYYFRVFATTNPNTNNATRWGFNVCVTYTPPPANDNCSGATVLTLGTTNSSGTVWNTSASSSIPVGCATGSPDDDVWYAFVASTANATVTLSALGSNLSTSGARVQVFSGVCSTLTSIACGTTSVDVTGLISGETYYIRVYSAGSGSIGGTATGSAFSITVSNTATTLTQYNLNAGRMNEIFQQTTLSAASVLNDPWEITYGSDNNLWLTEAKGYKVYRMNPATGAKTTVLDLSNGASGYLTSAEHTAFNVQFTTTTLASSITGCNGCWPQGGFAGLVLHPKFLDAVSPKNYVYVSYVHTFNSMAASNAGVFFTNRIVRFTYNTSTSKLESPVSLCDTLPGSSDHNSQRMIIAPVGGTNYLFYASGDMGSGQFGNAARPIKSQITASYEGKILRFNLEEDGDAGTLDRWIPGDNPYNGAKQSAVWCTGMRNNQGFAYSNGILYGSSHGPFSDDEINIIERDKNYGHPLVIGYAADDNYNNSKAGNTSGTILPLIVDESNNAAAISNYKDPLFSAYAAPAGNSTTPNTVNYIYTNNPGNGGWPSEGWSGMDIYTNTIIPGWKNSLVVGSLKWGRVLRLKLDDAGTVVVPTNGADTSSYFGSTNRFRDVAFSPDGRDLFVIMDKNATTSGPSAVNPVVPACGGCVQKYRFVGYKNNNATNRSTIPTAIPVTTGTANNCAAGTTVTIDAANNNLWVPITGPDGNIMAEIKANGNNLGTVTSSFFTRSGTVREGGAKQLYMNRNITITPQTQPSSAVSVRLYFTSTEFNTLKTAINSAGVSSGISNISNVYIYKNNDACGAAIQSAATTVTPVYAEQHGTGGYVLQANITSFSSFYFGNADFTTLPVQVLTFKGVLQSNDALLQWESTTEKDGATFLVERSLDGIAFAKIGTVNGAAGTGNTAYNYTDKGAALLPGDMVYYRLKVVDADGTFTYSKVVALRLPKQMDVMVFPNPVKENLNIRISSQEASDITIRVSDVQGRVVYAGKQRLSGSTSLIQVDVRQWKPQLYVVKITNSKGDVLTTQKFQKL